MTMKKTFLIFVLTIICSFNLIAQNDDTKRADKHFSRFEYVDAAEDYLDLALNGKGNTYVYSRLADCYYNVFNTQEAQKWYAKALADSNDPEIIFKYSQMLKANGSFEESNKWMTKFADMRPADIRSITFKQNPDYLPKILEKGKKFNVQNLELNSENSDFGGTVHNGNLYYVSARNNARKIYGWNEQPFLDIIETQIRTDGSFGDTYLMGTKINTKYHEGTVSFSPDGKTMYFSRESFFDKTYVKDSLSNNKFSVMNLYKATKIDGLWDDIEALPINSKNYNLSAPHVSQDGKTLFFHSDMPGGFGLADIYRVEIKEDGTFGEPINLGQKVNTEGQERFPFQGKDGTIYFSSDGHLGLGGLDVFFTKEIDGKMAPVRNVGIPVNSSADDFAFSINENGEGYVSSNRMGGRGSDDIYTIKKLQPICDVLINISVTDIKTGSTIGDALVSLTDSNESVINSKNTNSNGKSEFMIECNSDSGLVVSKEDYESKMVAIAGTRDEEIKIEIALEPIEKLIVDDKVELNPIYFDFDKANITAKAAFELDKLVLIMEKYPDLVIKATSHTDSRGNDSYNMALSDRRAKTTVQYIISKGIDANRISGEGKGETELINNCINCTDEEHQMNRRSEFLIIAETE